VYVETQTPTSNANGLVSLEIGGGTVVSGNMATINWANGPYFIKTETDPSGGSSYTITGTSQLLSAPYALYAKTSGSSTPGPIGPQGPIGLTGATGAQGISGTNGTNGQGVPTGGTANQVLAKVDGTNYNTTWVTPASGSADNLGNHTATQALNMSNQNITNANTTTTAQLNTSEISIGSTSTTIALTNINATSSDIDATGKSYIFIQSAISQYHVIHGIAGGYAGKILYLGTAAGTTWVNNSATETIATNRLSNIFINANAQSAGTGFHIFKLLYMTNVSGGRWVVIDQDL
jgi:hypothetical protein